MKASWYKNTWNLHFLCFFEKHNIICIQKTNIKRNAKEIKKQTNQNNTPETTEIKSISSNDDDKMNQGSIPSWRKMRKDQ